MRRPDFDGPDVRVWAIPMSSDPARRRASVCAYLINAPLSHPIWEDYYLGLIHLRPWADIVPVIYLPGATHELGLYAVDPEGTSRWDVVEGIVGVQVLRPANFIAQLISPNDASAMARMEKTVKEIARGELNPNTDDFGFVDPWVARYGDHCFFRRGRKG